MVQEAYQIKQLVSEATTKDDLLYLSVFISNRQFQYAIFNYSTYQLIELSDIDLIDQHVSDQQAIDLMALLIHNQLLNSKKFEKVNIALLNKRFTLLPESFSEANKLSDLMTFTNGNIGDEKILQHKSKYCDFCFGMKPEWLDFFGKTFPSASVRHAGALSISLLFEQFSLRDKQIYLAIHNSQIEICVKQNNALLFYNVFSYESKEDVLYYLLFSMEQLQLNPLLCSMAIAAELDTNADLIKSIKKYVKQVDFCVMDKSISIKDKSQTLPQHYYFTLLNQHLCAL
ncbi:MAG: DUF3822 family protein [Bacteroidota bacterium]